MFASHVYLWPLAVAIGGTVVVSGLRYLTLFIGLRLALRGAPEVDRLPIFREFARSVSLKGHSNDDRQAVRSGGHESLTSDGTRS